MMERRSRGGWPALLASALLAACSTAQFPSAPREVPSEPTASEILSRAQVAAGVDPFERWNDVAVSYEGEWGTVVQMLQPVLTDSEYRSQSEERLLLADGVVAQVHHGTGGTKTVLWDGSTVTVRYDGAATTEQEAVETSALVAEAYEMFLLGPAWLARRGRDWVRLDDASADGRPYYRILGRLRPGFGLSDEDQVVAWFDPETLLLHRVHFTLEGYAGTRGAHVDVTFDGHRKEYGYVWPTHFVERVRSPVDIHAHEWRLVGIDVDRDLTIEDVSGTAEEWSVDARTPARALGAPDGGPR